MNYILKWKLFVFILLLTLWFHFQQFGQQRKREIRLMKNREAARECRLTSFFLSWFDQFQQMYVDCGWKLMFIFQEQKEGVHQMS